MGSAAASVAMSRGVSVEAAVYVAPPDEMEGYLRRAGEWLGFSSSVIARTQARLEARYGLLFVEASGRRLAPALGEVPLLVVHDESDADVPYAQGQRLAAAWPGAQLRTTQGLGHRRILRDDAVVEAAVGFLVDRAGAAGLPG